MLWTLKLAEKRECVLWSMCIKHICKHLHLYLAKPEFTLTLPLIQSQPHGAFWSPLFGILVLLSSCAQALVLLDPLSAELHLGTKIHYGVLWTSRSTSATVLANSLQSCGESILFIIMSPPEWADVLYVKIRRKQHLILDHPKSTVWPRVMVTSLLFSLALCVMGRCDVIALEDWTSRYWCGQKGGSFENETVT